MVDEAAMWKLHVAGLENPTDRVLSGEGVYKDVLELKTVKLPPTTMTRREGRCRAVYKVKYSKPGHWQRCINYAYLDAYVDSDILLGESVRVALCYVHAGVCLRGNLRIAR